MGQRDLGQDTALLFNAENTAQPIQKENSRQLPQNKEQSAVLLFALTLIFLN